MNVILYYDGSIYSRMATYMVKALQLSSKTNVTITNVIPEHALIRGIYMHICLREALYRRNLREEQYKKALDMLREPLTSIRVSGLRAEGAALWGHTSDMIIKMARDKDATLIVIGARGITDDTSTKLGNTAAKVMTRAQASVLLVKKECRVLNRVLLAVDGSKYSVRAIQLLLDLPLPKRCQVIVLTALKSHVPALVTMPTLNMELNQNLMDRLRASEEEDDRITLLQTRDRFHSAGYKTAIDIMRGATADSILSAAERHNPDIIVVGARGANGFGSFSPGSVAEKVSICSDTSVLVCKT